MRRHVRAVALEWGLQELADSAELLVSELVTNAIQASAALPITQTPVVRVWVTSDGSSMTIHVWDASAAIPARHPTAVDDEGGRGLLLVETLSEDWGTCRKAAGKVVWVMITVADR